MALKSSVKLVLDLAPLAIFFIGYEWLDLYAATTGLIVTTFLSLLIIYWAERRIAPAPLITGLVVGIFGGLTLWLKDDTFIKIKPTLVNLAFALILLGGCLRGKGLLRYAFHSFIDLTPRGWFVLSLRWALFFLCLALLNELVWRHFSTATWVKFKVFGLMGLTLLFAFAQTGFIQRHTPQAGESVD